MGPLPVFMSVISQPSHIHCYRIMLATDFAKVTRQPRQGTSNGGWSRDSGESVQQIADEAFAAQELSASKDALKQSSRGEPANENKPQKKRGSLGVGFGGALFDLRCCARFRPHFDVVAIKTGAQHTESHNEQMSIRS